MIKGAGIRSAGRARRLAGFSRTELLITIGLVALLGMLAAVFAVKVRGRSSTAVCMNNLRQIGAAEQLYLQHNNDKLPYAFLHYRDQQQTSWDTLLSSYLRAALRGGKTDGPPPPLKGVNQQLRCPADTVPPPEWAVRFHQERRTYALGMHNMAPENWPPGADNKTGVGLNWTFGARGERPPSARVYNFTATNQQAAVTRSMLLAPAKTLAVTERVRSANVIGNMAGAVITVTADHIEKNVIPAEKYHGGKFNYLMTDGHVETLFPEDTVGVTGEAGDKASRHLGLWTIKAGD